MDLEEIGRDNVPRHEEQQELTDIVAGEGEVTSRSEVQHTTPEQQPEVEIGSTEVCRYNSCLITCIFK